MSLKNRVVNFYEKNKHFGKSFVAKHFLAEKVPKSTVYRLISCAEHGESGERKKGSGRPTKIATKATINWLTQKFNNSCGVSQKSASVALKCSRPYVSMMLKRHTNINCRNEQHRSKKK
jgi:transposase